MKTGFFLQRNLAVEWLFVENANKEWWNLGHYLEILTFKKINKSLLVQSILETQGLTSVWCKTRAGEIWKFKVFKCLKSSLRSKQNYLRECICNMYFQNACAFENLLWFWSHLYLPGCYDSEIVIKTLASCPEWT